MNKAVVIALLLVSSEALAQIKSFKSGDRINADEMNQNFQELVDEDAALKQRTDTLVNILEGKIDRLESAVTCGSSAVVGWWFTIVENFAGEGELVQTNFKQGGTIDWSLTTNTSRESGSGTWTTDNYCTVKATLQGEYAAVYLLAFLASDGKTMTGYIDNGARYKAGTFSRSRYIRNYDRLPSEFPKTNQIGS